MFHKLEKLWDIQGSFEMRRRKFHMQNRWRVARIVGLQVTNQNSSLFPRDFVQVWEIFYFAKLNSEIESKWHRFSLQRGSFKIEIAGPIPQLFFPTPCNVRILLNAQIPGCGADFLYWHIGGCRTLILKFLPSKCSIAACYFYVKNRKCI